MTKILITGANGFLGSNLTRVLSDNPEFSLVLTSQNHPEPILENCIPFYPGNLLDEVFLQSLIAREEPDVIINTVSLVNVDLCEENPQLAEQITVKTASNLAKSAQEINARMIYISTDQIFDGTRSLYTEQDEPNPINNYGKTKLDAERVTLHYLPDSIIIRTNFFGWSPPSHPPTFGEWIYNNLLNQKPMQLFTNFYFTPIEVSYLAKTIGNLITTDFSGILNVCGSDLCSKYEFGIQLASAAGLDPSPIEAFEMNASTLRARRPKDMSLSNKKCEQILHTHLPDLKESLKMFVERKKCIFL